VLGVEPGFEPARVVTAHLWLAVPNDPSTDPYATQDKRTAFVRAVADRLLAIPGVERVAVGAGNMPLGGPRVPAPLDLQDRAAAAEGEKPTAQVAVVTPEFFRTLGTPILRGRAFAESDDENGAAVAIVDQAAAERYWPGADPIGRQLRIANPLSKRPYATVVGVAGRTKTEGLDAPYAPHVYFPAYQSIGHEMNVYARGTAPAETLQEPIRRAVQAVDPTLPVSGVRAMATVVARSL